MKLYKILFFFLLSGCHNYIKYPDGGFDYPNHVDAKDTNFYAYPLKDSLSTKDSFWDANNYTFYRPFNEPNLSIKPQETETFRLTYGAALGTSLIIILTENCIAVKEGAPSSTYETDENRLTETERDHLHLLNYSFPIDTAGKKPIYKQYLDSIIKLYPQLLDPGYYRSLIDKTILPLQKSFTYSVTRIPLKKEQYYNLVEQINASGFWALPYSIKCDSPPQDDYGFNLEANTKRKYKTVSAIGCPGDTSKFAKACQLLVTYAKLDKEINLVWSNKTVIVTDPLLPEVKEKK